MTYLCNELNASQIHIFMRISGCYQLMIVRKQLGGRVRESERERERERERAREREGERARERERYTSKTSLDRIERGLMYLCPLS
jgi:hypothetical protein